MKHMHSSKSISVKNLSEQDFTTKYQNKVRHGKTARDRKSGAWGARFSNREARVQWQHDQHATNDTFPGATR